MKNINHVTIAGNLTRDPELRRTQSGLAVLGIGIAVNDSRKNQSGEWEEYPNYLDCTLIGERAEKLSTMLSKGQKVCIVGKLRQSRWEKDGQKHSKLEIIVDQIEFMSARQEPKQEQAPSMYDYDIPF